MSEKTIKISNVPAAECGCSRNAGQARNPAGLWSRSVSLPGRIIESLLAVALLLCAARGLEAQDPPARLDPPTKATLSLEQLIYPPSSLCLLEARGAAIEYPFQADYFRKDLLAYLRSADYLTVKTEEEVSPIISRNRLQVPETYEQKTLARICQVTDCEYLAYLRLIAFEKDLHDGFTIPVLLHRNKVTFSAELDVAIVDGKTGSLHYSDKVIGRGSARRGLQLYPVTEDPALHLNFQEKETLARMCMQNLARRTFEAVLAGIHKTLGDKFICYWGSEVHIISEKTGLCPICGSRLVKIKR